MFTPKALSSLIASFESLLISSDIIIEPLYSLFTVTYTTVPIYSSFGTIIPLLLISLLLPARIFLSWIWVITPLPDTSSWLSILISSISLLFKALYSSNIDFAIGWFEYLSQIAAYFKSSLFEIPTLLIWVTLKAPLVNVPVLSKTTVSIKDSK